VARPAGAAGRAATTGRGRRLLAAAWPKLLAVTILVAVWQVVVWSGWRPTYVLPAPATVAVDLAAQSTRPDFWLALGVTLQRGVLGFAVAVAIGSAIGVLVAWSTVMRAAIGSLLTGLQTLPSIVWFPLAILMFQLSEQAIFFVVVLGAAPSVANGLLAGIDQVPPSYRRLGHVLGARGFTLQRLVVLPAALPSYVTGLNQGWAFAWRSLMAGELLVVIEGRPSLGGRLAFAQEFGNAPRLISYMVVILVVGMAADAVFGAASRRLRARRGLLPDGDHGAA